MWILLKPLQATSIHIWIRGSIAIGGGNIGRIFLTKELHNNSKYSIYSILFSSNIFGMFNPSELIFVKIMSTSLFSVAVVFPLSCLAKFLYVSFFMSIFNWRLSILYWNSFLSMLSDTDAWHLYCFSEYSLWVRRCSESVPACLHFFSQPLPPTTQGLSLVWV